MHAPFAKTIPSKLTFVEKFGFEGILLMVSLIPVAGFFFIACVFNFYGLDENFCHVIREDLAKRRN